MARIVLLAAFLCAGQLSLSYAAPSFNMLEQQAGRALAQVAHGDPKAALPANGTVDAPCIPSDSKKQPPGTAGSSGPPCTRPDRGGSDDSGSMAAPRPGYADNHTASNDVYHTMGPEDGFGSSAVEGEGRPKPCRPPRSRSSNDSFSGPDDQNSTIPECPSFGGPISFGDDAIIIFEAPPPPCIPAPLLAFLSASGVDLTSSPIADVLLNISACPDLPANASAPSLPAPNVTGLPFPALPPPPCAPVEILIALKLSNTAPGIIFNVTAAFPPCPAPPQGGRPGSGWGGGGGYSGGEGGFVPEHIDCRPPGLLEKLNASGINATTAGWPADLATAPECPPRGNFSDGNWTEPEYHGGAFVYPCRPPGLLEKLNASGINASSPRWPAELLNLTDCPPFNGSNGGDDGRRPNGGGSGSSSGMGPGGVPAPKRVCKPPGLSANLTLPAEDQYIFTLPDCPSGTGAGAGSGPITAQTDPPRRPCRPPGSLSSNSSTLPNGKPADSDLPECPSGVVTPAPGGSSTGSEDVRTAPTGDAGAGAGGSRGPQRTCRPPGVEINSSALPPDQQYILSLPECPSGAGGAGGSTGSAQEGGNVQSGGSGSNGAGARGQGGRICPGTSAAPVCASGGGRSVSGSCPDGSQAGCSGGALPTNGTIQVIQQAVRVQAGKSRMNSSDIAQMVSAVQSRLFSNLTNAGNVSVAVSDLPVRARVGLNRTSIDQWQSPGFQSNLTASIARDLRVGASQVSVALADAPPNAPQMGPTGQGRRLLQNPSPPGVMASVTVSGFGQDTSAANQMADSMAASLSSSSSSTASFLGSAPDVTDSLVTATLSINSVVVVGNTATAGTDSASQAQSTLVNTLQAIDLRTLSTPSTTVAAATATDLSTTSAPPPVSASPPPATPPTSSSPRPSPAATTSAATALTRWPRSQRSVWTAAVALTAVFMLARV